MSACPCPRPGSWFLLACFTRLLLSAANTATCTQADNVKYHSRTYSKGKSKSSRQQQRQQRKQQIHGTTKDISAIAAALGQNSTGPPPRVESSLQLVFGIQYGCMGLKLATGAGTATGTGTGTGRAVKRTPAKDTCRMRKTKPKAKTALCKMVIGI